MEELIRLAHQHIHALEMEEVWLLEQAFHYLIFNSFNFTPLVFMALDV
jgi:hypothetical protein